MTTQVHVIYLAGLALVTRVALALLGALQTLLWRPEVTTPANSLLQIREGSHLLQSGVSPYSSSSCHVPPLVLALLGPSSHHDVLYVLPNILADLLGAVALHSTATALHKAHNSPSPAPHTLALLYLWHPAALLSCVAGTTSPWENAAVMGAVAGAAHHNLPAMTACFAVAIYLGGLNCLLLILPLILIYQLGLEDSCRPLPPAASSSSLRPSTSGVLGPADCGDSGSNNSSKSRPGGQQANAITISGRQQETNTQQQPLNSRQQQQQPRHHRSSSAPADSQQWPSWSTLVQCCGLVAVWSLALLLLSDLHLRRQPQHQCWQQLRGGAQAVWQQLAGPHAATAVSGAAASTAGIGVVGRIQQLASSCWIGRVHGPLLAVADYTPNIGLYWYFFTEMFEAFRPFFRFVFHSHAVIFAMPLTIRFGHRPLLVLVAQLLMSAMFKPYPSTADYVPWMCLVPLLQQQMQLLGMELFLGNSLLLLAVLTPAMWHQWINLDAANANFFYSATLLLAVWQLVVLTTLLTVTASADRALKLQSTVQHCSSWRRSV